MNSICLHATFISTIRPKTATILWKISICHKQVVEKLGKIKEKDGEKRQVTGDSTSNPALPPKLTRAIYLDPFPKKDLKRPDDEKYCKMFGVPVCQYGGFAATSRVGVEICDLDVWKI